MTASASRLVHLDPLQLQRRHGVIVCGRELVQLLGFRTGAAFRQAARRRTLPIETFFITGRRGRCARTADIAQWALALAAHCEQEVTEPAR